MKASILVAEIQRTAYLRIKFANMQMTVFKVEETFGLSSPLARCSQCGALFLVTSHIILEYECIHVDEIYTSYVHIIIYEF